MALSALTAVGAALHMQQQETQDWYLALKMTSKRVGRWEGEAARRN